MKSITKLDHPPCSPDLAPYDFWLFPKLKNVLNRSIFTDIPCIQHNVMLLQSIPETDFQDCFQQWHHHLTNCIASQKKSILKATAAATAQVSIFCLHTAIPGIKLSYHIQ
jgi:hypothetical protein